MYPILKNFLSVIRRYKLAATLNVLGLSVAFAAFMVIMIQLDYDNGFDKFQKDNAQIFRVESVQKTDTWGILSRPLAERFIDSSPYIVAGALCKPLEEDVFFHVENRGTRDFYKEKAVSVTPGFTDVFTFDFAEGANDALRSPDNVIIPLSLARKLFGKESAVGKQLVYDKKSQTVGAVYRDFPGNTIVKNHIYVPIPDDENKLNWMSWRYHAYIKVNEAANAQLLFDNFKRNFQQEEGAGETMDFSEGNYLRLTALPDIHFVTDVINDNTPKASRQTMMILFVIAVVIVTIAAINFTNFSTALTPMRIRSINTQRVLGVRRSMLRKILVVEAVIFGLASYLITLALVFVFRHSPLAQLVDADLSLAVHPLIVGGTALMAALTGLLAGLYPSRYMTSFAPALVLKGSFGLSPKGKKLRNTLIGIQYIASFVLIIGASFMYLQNYFMQNSPLGYDKEALITVDIAQMQENRDALTNSLLAYSGIENVAYGEALVSSSDDYNEMVRMYKGEVINFQLIPVNYRFLQVMGIEITEGRDFRQEDAYTETGMYVFNETARKKFDMEVNTTILRGGEIIGFIPDVKFASFRKTVDPMAFFVRGTVNRGEQSNIAYIRLKEGTNMRAAMSHIQSVLAGFDANYPFEVRFFDEVLQRLYENEVRLSSLISLFSLIAIFISIVGVFGLVVFDSECRRKEIGIRKVLGASTAGIIVMFNKAYFRIMAICFVVAAPTAWYAVSRWLQNFAYKTPMYWWVYVLAFTVIAVITVATVTFQNWRVASDDPVKSIKIE